MLKELLHPIAIDNHGNPIHISVAKKGNQYFCPFCKSKFIFNRSLRTGKNSRRPHFSHESVSPNCTSEGYLHSTFKILLLELLNSNLVSNNPFEMSFKCNVCQNIHNTNLLSGATAVKSEYDLRFCRPDIALIETNNRVYAVIEIVVTHEPDENTLKYYKNNQIVLIKIKLDTEEDLLKLEEKTKTPSQVILNNLLQCPVFAQQQHINSKILLFQNQSNRMNPSGPRINQIESQKASNERRRSYAIKNNYKKKKR